MDVQTVELLQRVGRGAALGGGAPPASGTISQHLQQKQAMFDDNMILFYLHIQKEGAFS